MFTGRGALASKAHLNMHMHIYSRTVKVYQEKVSTALIEVRLIRVHNPRVEICIRVPDNIFDNIIRGTY